MCPFGMVSWINCLLSYNEKKFIFWPLWISVPLVHVFSKLWEKSPIFVFIASLIWYNCGRVCASNFERKFRAFTKIQVQLCSRIRNNFLAACNSFSGTEKKCHLFSLTQWAPNLEHFFFPSFLHFNNNLYIPISHKNCTF